jgi:hypothetical protein
MNCRSSKIACFAIAVLVATAAIARADCESDLIQLRDAYKSPNLATDGKAALDDAKSKAVTALKKDDDAACHKAVAEAMNKAGLKLQ